MKSGLRIFEWELRHSVQSTQPRILGRRYGLTESLFADEGGRGSDSNGEKNNDLYRD
jgi:hypothetical protein